MYITLLCNRGQARKPRNETETESKFAFTLSRGIKQMLLNQYEIMPRAKIHFEGNESSLCTSEHEFYITEHKTSGITK